MKPGFASTLALLACACADLSGASDLSIEAQVERPNWNCLGSGITPFDPNKPVVYTGGILRLGDNRPVSPVTARLCEDNLCEQPIELPPSTDGTLRFEVPPAFRGQIQLESPGLMPAVVEILRPIGSMRKLPDIRMLDEKSLVAYAAQTGVTADPTLGHALFWAEDCDGWRAKGVSVRPKQDLPGAYQYYVVGSESTSRVYDATLEGGGGGFINLPTNRFVDFEAVVQPSGRTIKNFGVSFRPGTTTFFVIEPE